MKSDLKEPTLVTVASRDEATTSDPSTDVLTTFKNQFNKTLALTCFLLACSSFSHEFGNQGFATTQAMDSFSEQFGEYNAKTHKYAIPAYFLSYLNSFQYIEFAVGLLIGSYVSSEFGRKWSIRSMSAYTLVTAIIAVTSKRKEQILSARVLNQSSLVWKWLLLQFSG